MSQQLLGKFMQRSNLTQTSFITEPKEFFSDDVSGQYDIKYFDTLKRVLYTDTDSLIYVVRDGETPLEMGDCLGQLTD